MQRMALALGFCALLAIPVAQARPLFPHPVHLTGSVIEPVGVVTADLDDDGILDLVVGGEGTGVAVLLGTGTGSFEPAVSYETGIAPYYPVVGDLDADGILDLAVGNLADWDVSILLGNGDGTFGAESRYEFSWSLKAGQIVIRDFDEDGHQDLVVQGWRDEGGTALLPGRGDGTFEAAEQLPGTGKCVAAGDFDGDGHEDFATAFQVFAGNGDGTFALRDQLTQGDDPLWIAAGDLDGDEIPDLVTANQESFDVSVLIGNGDGTFAPERRFAAGDFPQFVGIHDLNEDGLQDLSVGACAGNGECVSLLFGTGGGEFAPAVFLPHLWQGNSAIGDFDGDGFDDLAHTNRQTEDHVILFGNGDGTFVDIHGFDVGEGPVAVAVGDFDGDGREDAVTANYTSNDLSVLLANGAGTFAPEIRVPVGSAPQWVAVAELNGDAHLDLAVANSAPPGSISLLAGVGDGSFTDLGNLALGLLASPNFVVAADLDGDLHDDLVVSNAAANNLWIFPGDGEGNFGPRSVVIVGLEPSWVAVADLDGDDLPDLSVANADSFSISVLLGVGDGTFTDAPTVNLPGNQKPSSVVAEDLDGDGARDLAVVCPESQRINVFYGNGQGTFPTFPQTLSLEYWYQFWQCSLLAEDLNGDGVLDLVAPTYNARVGVLVNEGSRSFGPVEYFYGSGRRIAAGDFNLDGRTDLFGQQAIVMLNQGGPSALSFEGDRSTLVWPAATGALSYDVYRGDLAALVDADDDGLPDSGYGVCKTDLDDDARDTFFVDAEIPSPEGAGFFYLMSVTNADGDQGLGTTSAGLERQPTSPCP